ncbi:MAG: hypothetical protein KI790_02030 [Cyclobacteriaceae bacterium]|nr:hypothetical protein [Cyclobacteriaceae bacterium HetDA_MAG_MS6]
MSMNQGSLIIAILALALISCNRIERKIEAGVEKAKSLKESIRKEIDPTTKEIFEERTGLLLTSPQQHLIEKDTYFPLEGEYSQVFTVTSEQIDIWKNGPPPWDATWLTGKIPSELTDKFENGENISGNTILSFREFCCDDENMRFHNGQVLILELDKQKVWYANWDY